MLLAKKIAVVIPAYRAKYSIEKVLTDIPKYVDNVIVVDDSCPLGTGQHVLENIKMSNVTVLFNDENRGVGGATKAGYAEAIKFNADIIFKIDADGQMDTSKIETFGFKTAICNTSARFFSPPENPSLRYLERNSSLNPTFSKFSLRYF